MKSTLRAGEVLKRITVAAVFVLAAVMLNIRVYAADFNVSVSSGEATQGENVTVTVSMSAGVTVGAYDLALTYDANVLEYVSGADGGGGGSLRLYNDSNYTTSYTTTITFKAKAAGSTKVSVIKQGDICDIDLNDLTLKATDGTITVNAPVTASSNANLSSLSLMAVRADGWSGSVTLMPEFSKDVTAYQLWLGSEFTKLSVSAVAEDGNAKITVGGTDLKAGQDNNTTITVTAEDGTVKTYAITVHVKAEEATTAAENNNTDTPTEAPTETPTEEPTDNSQENPTDNNNSPAGERNVTLSEKSYTVLDVEEGWELPEGFERKAVGWNGTEVMGASDQSGILTLIYMMNNETNEGSFFVYDNEKSSYIPFLSYTITQRAYVMLMAEEDFMFEGKKAAENNSLELTTLNIAGGYVDAYKLKNTENIYIVRAMNWDNKIGYYYYSTTDGSMLPCFEITSTTSENQAAETATSAASSENNNILKVICFILAVVAAALAAVIIYMAVKLKNLSGEGSQDDDEGLDEYDDEEEYSDEDEYSDENEYSDDEEYNEADENDDEYDYGDENAASEDFENGNENAVDSFENGSENAVDSFENGSENAADSFENVNENVTDDNLKKVNENITVGISDNDYETNAGNSSENNNNITAEINDNKSDAEAVQAFEVKPNVSETEEFALDMDIEAIVNAVNSKNIAEDEAEKAAAKQEMRVNEQHLEAYEKQAEAIGKETQAAKEQAEIHEKQAEAYEEQTEVHEEQAEAREEQTETYKEQIEACEEQAEAHREQAENHEEKTEAYEEQAEAYERQTGTYEEQAEAFEDKAEAYEEQSKTHDSRSAENEQQSEAEQPDILGLAADRKDENMSEQELDNAIDDILGQLFK